MNQELMEELDDGVLTLTMNRPQRLNAMTLVMLQRMLAALRQAASDPAVRVVVLTGAGNAFCAGGDVKAMAEDGDADLPMEQRVHRLREAMECSRLLHDMEKPTMAVARGAVAGAGLSLALACDLFLASDNAKVVSAFVNVGLSGDFGGNWLLTRRLGWRAREFVMLSPRLNAQEALEWGLLNRVLPDARLNDEATRLARRLADSATIALGHIKANLNLAEHSTLAAALDQEALRHIRCGMTEDHMEAAQAFVEKRVPRFRHR